jgi:hypothetical protein
MLAFQLPLPVKLLCGLIYKEEGVYQNARKSLAAKYGPIDFESEKITFDFTDYYSEELGKPLYRRFISFRKLRGAETFVKIKLFCVKLEKKFSKKDKRTILISTVT